jgi:hypothetical protein
MTASQLEKLCRKYALVQRHGQDSHPEVDAQRRHVRRRDLEDGMVKIEAVLHPEEAELIWTMLDHAASRLAREAVAAALTPDATTHGDSAESAGTSEVESSQIESDSVESTGTAEARSCPAESDSAESPAAVEPCCAAAETPVAEQTEWSELTRTDDSAAGSEVAGCSLLDRLLDDAIALRSIEPIAAEAAGELCDSPAPAPSQHEAEARRGQPAQRASVLRDRAAAAFNRADALVELAQEYLRGDRPERSPIEVMLTVPASVLRGEHADPVEVGELGESFLSRGAARRLSCDAGVVEIIEDDHGAPLSVGRKQRTIAGALRRALHRRDRSCTYPGCTNRLFLEGHHIKHWADGGETSLSNAVLVCGLHHRHVHELGYTVELGPDQRPRFRDPQGQLVAVVPQPPSLVDLGWPQIRAANETLAIDANTIAGPWDGTPVDYARIVGHLAAAEGHG